jgi:hypothetical protein
MLLASLFACGVRAQPYDRVASIAQSPLPRRADMPAGEDQLIALVKAMDKATHSSTRITTSPFSRSLMRTASGEADFHLPFIQDGNSPAPPGLQYVSEADFGESNFVIYSRKSTPLNAQTVASAKVIEVEPDHQSFFPFPVKATYCISCSLDQVLAGRADALIVAADIVDPLLTQTAYKGIHRALYKSFPVRALVPASGDTTAVRHYLIEGAGKLKESGELLSIRSCGGAYADWQP